MWDCLTLKQLHSILIQFMRKKTCFSIEGNWPNLMAVARNRKKKAIILLQRAQLSGRDAHFDALEY